MMKKLWLTLSIGVLALTLNGCTPISTEPPCSGASCPVEVGQVDLLVSSQQLASDGKTPVTVTVRVRSTANAVVSGASVLISADSGDLVVVSGITDSNGLASATISPGTNKANRTITITATSGSITKTNTVQVSGTTITTTGVNAVTIASPLTVKATVRDSSGAAISGASVTVTSSNPSNMPVTPTTATSDSGGEITVTATPSVSGTYSISFSALGSTQTHAVTADGDAFAIDASSAVKNNSSLLVNTDGVITISWSKNGVAQALQNVIFSATRGTFNGSSGTVTVTTDAAGKASATLRSASTGLATVTISGAAGTPSTSIQLTYTTNQATQISLQPDTTKVTANVSGSTANKISLPALVRDSSNNLVKDAVVTYSISKDSSGGTLSGNQATTDISGVATLDYIAGTGTSGQDGVTIQAKVVSIAGVPITPASQPTTTINLTVGGTGLFVRIGTDNNLDLTSQLKYIKTYAALVSDAGGGAVPNANVTFIIKPIRYFKGQHTFPLGSLTWQPQYSVAGGCTNEDLNNNGTLDSLEDTNGDGVLTPGNRASITPLATTDSSGFATTKITYTRDHAYWVEVKITATAKVGGTEASDSATFILPGYVSDYNLVDVAPPGRLSPFGQANSCSNPN